MSALKKQYEDFMANFEKGQFVAVDIGASAVKVALLSKPKKNRLKLEKYASIELPEAAIIEDEVQKPEEIIDFIAQALEQSGIKKKISIIGLDGPNTMTKRIKVPDGSADEVEDNVIWEAEQYIPFGADESEIDFHVIATYKEEDVKDVLLAAVREDVAESYISYVKEAGLNPLCIDLNVLALNNLFEFVYSDDLDSISEEGAIVIEMGAQTTTVLVYKNDGPVLTKEISIGGLQITEDIQKTMGVSFEEAEDLKKFGDENGNLPEEVVEIIDSNTNNLIDELKKVLNFYITVGSSEQINQCYITGGSSLLPSFEESISNGLNCNVTMIDIFDKVEFSKNIDQDEALSISTCGFVSIGLGMRDK